MGTTTWILMFVAGTMFLVAMLAVAARKILGLRVGLMRAVLAGTFGVIAESVLGSTVQLEGHRPIQISLQLGVGVLIAMGFLALAEAVAPSGSLGGPMDWIGALRTRAARTHRYGQIMSIAVRHGLAAYVRGRGSANRRSDTAKLARNLRLALEEGGVTFVKLGQVMATRHDLLPPEFVTELSRLHNRVCPVPWERVREVLTEDFGRDPDTVFSRVDHQPVAAAAIAQVHRGQLRTGEEVAIKVQRPGILAVVERDLDIMRRLVSVLANRTRWGRAIGLADLADGFATALLDELDFRIEARNTAAILAADAAHGGGPIILPVAHEQLSTERVLILDWLDGIPLGSAGSLVAQRGLDPGALARTLLESLLRQIVADGVFHADPHPGNVLLLEDGRLALLDFGSVARLDAGLRAGLQHLLLAANSGDPAALRDALLEIVYCHDDVDKQRLERALGRFTVTNLADGSVPDMSVFSDLLVLTAEFGLEVPPEIAAVFRALLALEGTISGLTTEFNLVVEARRSALSLFTKQFTERSLPTMAASEMFALLPMLRRVPRRIDRITESLERGEFSVKVRVLADERERKIVTRLLHSALTAFLGGITGLMAVLLLGTTGGPAVTPDVSLHQIIGYHLLVVSSVLLLRVLFLITRQRT
ncbi:ABC1 kinase family protein [Haloechinothrix halophila]|uniref:ABC1 kinase family protein n=1 Tax=Haloechinothrix halophila TaxID=1069073 RepID=UPI000405B082|nr:AarF/UbiB family protein [Haloechinothrix halophila]